MRQETIVAGLCALVGVTTMACIGSLRSNDASAASLRNVITRNRPIQSIASPSQFVDRDLVLPDGSKLLLCTAPEEEKKRPSHHARKNYDLTRMSRAQQDTLLDSLFGTNASPSPSDAVEPLTTPLTYSSKNGLLDVDLTLEEERIQAGKYQLNVASYNKEYAGPVLRVRPGDLLRVRFHNKGDEPTNLHFHGLEVTPLGAGDNMMVVVSPNKDHVYEFRIPKTHRPGTFWYHSHMHYLAEDQLFDGMSGMLIIDPPAGRVFPELRERLMVLKNFQLSPSGDAYRVEKTYWRDIRSINGQFMPRIDIRPGETQLWRFSNEAANLIYRLTLKGLRFRVVARDGYPVPEEIVTDELIIPSASRADVLVDGGDPGNYVLVDEKTFTGPQGNVFRAQNLALINVAGAPMTPRPKFRSAQPLADLTAAKIDARRTIVFSEDDAARHYFVNGREFDHARVDTRVPLGNTEEWTIRNSSDELHVFHIHQVNFQVMEINGVPQRFEGRLDTVIVPMWGEVKIRMKFDNPVIVGRFMYHCHILEHEDKGMMANIEVYDPNAPAGANPSGQGAVSATHGHDL